MARKVENLVGREFGCWRVVSRAGSTKNNVSTWNCVCAKELGGCGTVRVVTRGRLIRGSSTNCGCVQRETNRKRQTKHGCSGKNRTGLYIVWVDMLQRCYNSLSTGYHRYGGRGITVCEEWHNSFESFQRWALATNYQKGLQIDRINNDGGYCPDNCRWVTSQQNMNNRSCTRKFTLNGETKLLCEWCDHFNMPLSTVDDRIRRGWTIEQALTIPLWQRCRNAE